MNYKKFIWVEALLYHKFFGKVAVQKCATIGQMIHDFFKKSFNKTLFTKIDIRNVTEISILSKKAKILSSHPSSSYKFSGDKKIIQALKINDYKAFWANSKYLVIMVD